MPAESDVQSFKEDKFMSQRKKIEVFSAGCHICREAIETVKRVVGTDHDIEVLDMNQDDVAALAKRHGIRACLVDKI
jgi:glutaredoxin 3